MPLGQSLRRAFLKLPCGHGGSQFRKDDPGVIPPSRVPTTPQTEQLNIAASVPSVPRTRKTPNLHKDSSNFPRASTTTTGRVERRVDEGAPEVKQLSAVGPDHNRNPGPIHDTGYNRYSEPVDGSGPIRGRVHAPESVVYGEKLNQPGSPLRNELRRSSTDSQSSDYSNNTIAHSLCHNSGPTSRAYGYGQGTDAEPHETRELKSLEKSTQPAVFVPTTDGVDVGEESDTSDHTLADRHDKPVVFHENSHPGPRQPLGTIPSFINSPRVNTGNTTEKLMGACEQEPRRYRVGKEEGDERYTHGNLCAAGAEKHKRHQCQPPIGQAPVASVQKRSLDPITHTRIRPVEHEEVTNFITREIHHTDIHPIIQPIAATERLPIKHYLETPDVKLIEISAEDAEMEGSEEVWTGDLVVGKDTDGTFKSIDNEIGAEEDAAGDREHRKY